MAGRAPGLPGPHAGEPWRGLDPTAQRVLLTTLRHGPLSRADLARRLGLSTASLTRLTKPMLASGLLHEGDPQAPDGKGRPAVPVAVDPDRGRFAGITVTGTRLHAALLDLGGTVVARASASLRSTRVDAVVDRIAGVVADWSQGSAPPAAVGVALGATVVDSRRVRRAVHLGWRDVPLAELVSDATARPVAVANDVQAFALDLHWFGPGRGADPLAVLTLGTGVGAGLVVDDRVVVGVDGTAGAIAHLPLPGGRRRCAECGRRGCATAELSTAALAAEAADRLGHPATAAQVVRAAPEDGRAAQLVDRVAERIAEAVEVLARVSGPSRVVVSGDGVVWARAGEQRIRRRLVEAFGDAGPELVIDRRFTFGSWARGAAVTALLHAITAERPDT